MRISGLDDEARREVDPSTLSPRDRLDELVAKLADVKAFDEVLGNVGRGTFVSNRADAPSASSFSLAVRLSSRAANCPVSESTLRTASASLTTSYPQTVAEPLVGSISVASIRTMVVLPAPFGPSSETTEPDGNLELKPFNGRESHRSAW